MTDDNVLKTGVVKFYSLAAGYGFIVDDASGSGDIFVHADNLKKNNLTELHKGDRVSFVNKKKGFRFYATDIKLL